MKKRKFFLILTLFFLVGAVASIPHGFQIKWWGESVYAQAIAIGGINAPSPPHHPDPVPAPPTVILIGLGLAAAGGYWGIRKFWK